MQCIELNFNEYKSIMESRAESILESFILDDNDIYIYLQNKLIEFLNLVVE